MYDESTGVMAQKRGRSVEEKGVFCIGGDIGVNNAGRDV